MTGTLLDTVIIGGGPAGLSAALVLGRCRRTILLFDSGQYRNSSALRVNGFLTRDGIAPQELLRLAREDLKKYDTVRIAQERVMRVTREADGTFALKTAASHRHRARTLILATGMQDVLPAVPGIRELYGRGVYHCPFCDAYDVRDLPIAVYGLRSKGVGLARMLTHWSPHITLCTDGPSGIPRTERQNLHRRGIVLREERITRLLEQHGSLAGIAFADGTRSVCSALFFKTGQHQHAPLAHRLGCRMKKDGGIRTDARGRTSVPGVFAAGDAVKEGQQVVVAAAEGTKAAMELHNTLAERDR